MRYAASRGLRTAMLLGLGLGLAAPPSTADPVVGAWSEVFEWPLVAIHMVQLHTGEILIWSHDGRQARVLDPKGECWEGNACFTLKPSPNDVNKPNPNDVNNVNVNVFCGGHTHLDDGTVIVNGGHVQNHVGRAETFLFEYDHDADDWSWTALGEVEDADFARWYPTLTTLPDGRVLNVSGSQLRCSGGPRQGDLCRQDADCPAASCNAFLVKQPEVFDPADRTWTTLTGVNESVEFYPFNFVGPEGHVFFAGADVGVGTPDIPSTANFNFIVDGLGDLDPVALSTHAGGSAVMYEPGRILKAGGGDTWPDAIADAEIIDLNGAATWAATSSMNVPRRLLNLTVLPDGTVLATGGTRRGNLEFERTCGGSNLGAPCNGDGDCAGGITCQENPSGEQLWVSEAEIWDPTTGAWTLMAGAQVPRMYHSTALLLPDGRVLSAGGGPKGFGGATHTYANAEIYSPPYLFTGTSPPTISEAPEIVYYGRSFRVESPEAADVGRVSLVRLGAVTHSFDQDRRFVPLTFNPVGDFGLDVDAPAGPNVAPPGYYMLFLLSSEGVPSVARFVRLLPANPGGTHEYAAKVVCGAVPPESPSRREPGHYSTSVNVHNPGPGRTRFFKKLALTYPPGDQREGEVLPIGHHALGYDEALQSDCADLRRRLIPKGTAPFFEGYLVIQSHGALDVTAVYTTSAADPNGEPTGHSSVDVERVPERRPETDLSVNKTVLLLPPVNLGRVITWHLALYTINVANAGPGVAGGVVLHDELALEVASAFGVAGIVTDPIVLPPGAAITSTAQPAANLSTMTIELADLAPGETATVSFWALALTFTFGDLNPHARLRDTATVSSSAVEAAPANNTVTVEAVLVP